MTLNCFNCQHSITVSAHSKVGRKDECPKCKADVHVCKNCNFYDSSAYNMCKEPQAERVVDKDRSNFCDFFAPSSNCQFKQNDERTEALKKLDDLFKK